MKLVALLTDLGTKDAFVGIMKGVILSRRPDAVIVDLSHEVPPQDIRTGAYILMSAVGYFPKGTLFVSVVDPGVGSRRSIIWARTSDYSFLAPDNGLLSWVELRQKLLEVRNVVSGKLFLKPVSSTFHGRDIFSPVAASLLSGLAPSRLGPVRKRIVNLPFPVVRRKGRQLEGEIICFDRFGNAITNLVQGDVPRAAVIACAGRKMGRLRKSYCGVSAGKPLAIIGSTGFVELSIRDGNFAGSFHVRSGARVVCRTQ